MARPKKAVDKSTPVIPKYFVTALSKHHSDGKPSNEFEYCYDDVCAFNTLEEAKDYVEECTISSDYIYSILVPKYIVTPGKNEVKEVK